jgi:predicted aconitase with swiveling domain
VTTARVLVHGDGEGEVLTLSQPLSFWGGLDAATGRIVDPHHPQLDACLTGRIVVMPSGRGSSSSSSVLAEAIRLGSGPAAIVLAEADPIVALGAIVADELYDVAVPVVQLTGAAYEAVAAAAHVRIRGATVEGA